MDKEKQIEEMAQYLKGYLYPLDNNSIENCKILASALISQGWVKLPKDSVVLTQEQFKILCEDKVEITHLSIDEEFKKECEYEIKQERKKTAEKILRVGEKYADEFKGNFAMGFGMFLAWIQTNFGVEIND